MSDILLVAVNSSFSHTNIAVRYLKYYADRFLCSTCITQGDCDSDIPKGECDKAAVPARNFDSGPVQGDLSGVVASPIQFCEFTINQPLGEIIRGINSQNPKIILFSTYIWNIETVVRIAKNIKALRPEIVVAAGGPEAGFRGSDFLKENPDFDFVMKGEGEETFRQIVEREKASAAPQGNALSAQQCGASRGDSDLSQGAAPAGDLDGVISTQQCDGSLPQGDLGFVPGAQQCGALVPQGEKFLESLKNVKGLYLRNPSHKNDITFTGDQELICDMGTIPFPYPDLEKMDVDHKIFYYESSRGCPFSCAYCMSSLDTKVRFVPLEKVYADLQRFLDAGVKLVKFVDRTYNLKPERYVGIWKYIMEHHNGKTMFHFEIEGEFLSEEAMEFLQTVPEGIMQFEIGVQSSNPVVLKACGRSPETEKLHQNILCIPKTIHTHLDLIAGLPFEDLESFGRSFDFVMSMEPDVLQLGFLKVLYGAPVNSFCGSEPGWKWMKTPPYEILETPYLSYDEILFLKDLETALDAYWNDHHFDTVMRYLAFAYSGSCHNDMGAASQAGDMDGTSQGDLDSQHCAAAPAGTLDNAPSAQHCGTSQGYLDLSHGAAWWKLFVSLTKWLRTKDAFASAHQKDYWAQMLYEYLEWQEYVAHHGGFVLSAQHCAAVPQGNVLCPQQCTASPSDDLDKAPTAQQCAAPSGDFDSGALDNALSSSQCNVARELLRFDYIAGGKKTNPPAWLRRNYDDQGHYDALQNTTGIKHSRLDFVYSDFDTFSVNPLAPATWHAAPAAPSGALDNAPSEQQCGTPQGDQDNVERSQQGATYSVLFLYARKESDHPTDFQRVPHQILIH